MNTTDYWNLNGFVCTYFYYILFFCHFDQRDDSSERHQDKEDKEKDKNENLDIEFLKVPALTISLRPGTNS